MTSRHLMAVISIGMVLMIAGCGEGDDIGDDGPGSSADPSTATTASEPTMSGPTTSAVPQDAASTTGEPAELQEVIVELNVPWRPEADLGSDEAVAEQRAAIAEAQEQVINLLEGTEFRVVRLFDMTPQMAIAVTGEGIFRLNTSDLVSGVSVDVPEPPTP